MNKLFTKIVGVALGASMAVGVGVAVANNRDVAPAHAASFSDYTKLTTSNLSSLTTSKKVVIATSDGGTGVTGYSGSDATVSATITEWLEFSVTAVNTTDETYSLKDSSTNKWITLNSSNKFTISATSSTDIVADANGYFKYVDGSSNTRYLAKNGTYYRCYKGNTQSTYTYFYVFIVPEAKTAATINGANSVNVGSQWSPTNITEDVSGNIVTGATYSFAASDGATISSSSTANGTFTCSSAGKVTVSATKSGYEIASKVVTVNSTEPYINLTLNSSADAYTGQNVSISASYGNGVAGLNWSVQSGSVTSPSGTNSGYTAKIAGSTGTLTIRATDTGSSLYSEVSVSVTKTAFDPSPAATASVAEGKTTTLSAALNSGGTINWESDDTSVATVTATGGSVTVTGVAEGTATITATSADDTSVYAECDVTVTEAPSEIVITQAEISGFTNSYKEYDWTYGTGTNAISGKIKAYKNSSNIQMNHNNTCYIYNTDAVKGYITGITFTKVSGTTDLTCWVGTSALSSDPASGGSTNTTYTWSFDAEDHYTYFRVATSGSTGARVASAITITYQKVSTVDPTGITLDDSSTINMDTYGYGRRRLIATVEPFNANDKTVTWGTSDSSVVTIADGVLTAVGTGTTTVYATTANYVSDAETPDLKASVTVNVTEALYKKATFVPTSTSAATQTDDYLPAGSVSLSASSAGSWNNDKSAIQLTSGKDVTFTISGYAGMKISGIDIIVSSNGAAGSGSLSVTGGTTNIFEIETAPFSDPTWNGAYDANPCDLYRATTEYVVGSGETVEFSFSATANSLYVHSVAIRYLDYSLEQWCESFLSTITCDGSGAITDDSKWDDLGIEFLDLDEDLRNIAAEATANKDSSNVIEQAMARYDLIIRKYGTSAHDDYIGRFGEGKINGPLDSARTILGNINGNASTVAIIIVVSAITLTSIGGYFFIRRRKKQY